MGFRFGVWSLGVLISSVWDFEFWFLRLRFGVLRFGLRYRVWDFRFEVLGFWAEDFEFGILFLGF